MERWFRNRNQVISNNTNAMTVTSVSLEVLQNNHVTKVSRIPRLVHRNTNLNLPRHQTSTAKQEIAELREETNVKFEKLECLLEELNQKLEKLT